MAVDKAFVEDYYDLANDVSRATHLSFTPRLRQWLGHIDGNATAVAVASSLAPDFQFAGWYASTKAGADQKGGSAIDWSVDRREKLGQVLALFRHFADTPDEVLQFGLRMDHSGPKLDAAVRAVTDDLFDPLARDLIKLIERAEQPLPAAAIAPASDRVVRLDDNYAAALDLRGHLSNIETAVAESNELADDIEARDQAVAELRAGQELMRAARVRVAAIAETLLPSLKWIGEKAAGTLIGIAVGAVLALIAQIFGLHILKP